MSQGKDDINKLLQSERTKSSGPGDRYRYYYCFEFRNLGYTDNDHVIRFALEKEKKSPCRLIISEPFGAWDHHSTILRGAQF